jgi:hypothetical protein
VLAMGISIPIVIAVAGFGLHRIRHAVTRARDSGGGIAA